MTEPSDPIARAAAEALTARFGAALPMDVEKLILQRDAGQPPERYIGVAEGIAIAALILQCAQFAWQIYKDTRDKRRSGAGCGWRPASRASFRPSSGMR